MTKSRIFLYFCLAFVAGIFAASFIFFPQLLMIGFLIAGVFLISVFWPFGKLRASVIVGFCLLFFVLGIWRHQFVESKIVYLKEQNVDFIGIVVKEPDIRPSSIKLVIKSDEIGSRRILVMTSRYPEYQYGDKLKISGFLKTPPVFNDFDYRTYLKKDGIFSVMDFPKIELLDSGFGNPVMEVLLSFKNKFQETSRTFISPPQQWLLEALVFGEDSGFSDEWKDKLNFSGTRHIAAVSGMNITIISSLIFSFMLKLGFRKNRAFYLSIGLLFLYILMIGAPASAVRAFIMAGIFLLAQRLGRLSSASRAVFFAATFMLVFNPLLLANDLGFQLSFLAILGLVYLQPFFSDWLDFFPNPKFFPLKTTLSATLSAQIFTLPVLLYNFGYFSTISLIANILIVPLLAPITILIFIFGISSIIFRPLGFLLFLPAWLFLTYIIKTIDFLSSFPWASLSIGKLHWIWLIIFYLILGSFIWWYNYKRGRNVS